eukprot:5858975-Amphidinium_carterae.2
MFMTPPCLRACSSESYKTAQLCVAPHYKRVKDQNLLSKHNTGQPEKKCAATAPQFKETQSGTV